MSGGDKVLVNFSEPSMHMADLEAAFVGNLARYCMAMGSIPPKRMYGFWWVNRECKGLGALGYDEEHIEANGRLSKFDFLDPIRPTIQHLRAYAGEVVETEGVDALLMAGAATRVRSELMFPNEAEEWVTERQACEITGRKPRTINEWRRRKWVTAIESDGMCTLYLKSDLALLAENIGKGKSRKLRT